ncbi:hypothetical protein cypCar_00029113 [Cyprinus carpio]|nr:hypothetical protein cypCar_00029113 [Cyprinus carpio]
MDEKQNKALDVRVPESPAVALFGTDAVLNCSFSGVSEFNLSELSVFWQLSDTKRAVHSFWQSRDQLSDQEERFSNRTSLFPDQLPAGNASLLLRRVANEEGLFSVRSVLTVILEPSSTYSCRLMHPLLGEEGQASVTISGVSILV